jgi:exonuclease 3'-5' domain-containing protein 1
MTQRFQDREERQSKPSFTASEKMSVTPCTFVDDVRVLARFVSSLTGLSKHPPSLYIDLEGKHPSRDGSVSIMQVFVAPHNHVYLLDIFRLGGEAFSAEGSDGTNLRSILQSHSIPKVFFDVRNDSDALYSHFGISLAGVVDLQLMEIATRSRNLRCVNGLARCIENDAPMNPLESEAWSASKDRGKRLFAPELGGRYEVFDQRPLAEEIKEYCVQDVVKLPTLWRVYWQKMTQQWDVRTKDEAEARVKLSQEQTYNGHGKHMAMGPSGWQNMPRGSTFRTAPAIEIVTPAVEVGELERDDGKASEPASDDPAIEEKSNSDAKTGDSVADAVSKLSLAKDSGAYTSPRVDLADTTVAEASTANATTAAAAATTPTSAVGSDEDDDEDDDFWHDRSRDDEDYYAQQDSDSDRAKDYTACDKECGYCGHCPY